MALPRGQRPDRIEHTGFGDGQHRQVNAGRQLVYRLDTGAAVDFRTAAADEMQHTVVAIALQVALDKAAK